MIRNVRVALTYLVLIASTGVSVAAGVLAARQGLPERGLRDYSAIVAWLATNDAAKASPEMQRRLIARIDESMSTDFDWTARIAELPTGQRQRCLDSLFELMRVWFLDKVTAYHEIRHERHRERFVARETQSLLRWPAIRSAVEGSQTEGGRRGELLLALFARANDWLKQSTPEQQVQIREFLAAAQYQLVQNMSNRIGVGGDR
ncbi:MAG: hypothetical protein K1X74_16165 [Pirellulales bacterium]|nr:hypothetical protein [Pirellulales bacterium]